MFSKTISEYVNLENSGHNVLDFWKEKSVSERKKYTQENTLPYTVMALSVEGDLNIGTIIRSAHLHGAEKIIIFGRRKYDRRGAVGSQNYTLVDRTNGFIEDTINLDPKKFVNIINEGNYYPVFIEQGGCNLHEYSFVDCPPKDKNLLIIVGNETNGIPQDILNCCDHSVVSIPQCGIIRSFNVSNALNMALYELRRQMNWF